MQAYQDLIQRWKEANLLGSCAELLAWDERTLLPKGGANHRAEQLALLARLSHQMQTDPRIGELLNEAQSEADTIESANVREIKRMYDRAVKLPASLVEELARVSVKAQQAWEQSRKEDDFAQFQPWLEKIVDLKRQEAKAIGYQTVPYDALLEDYEPGATTAEITELFRELRTELVKLLEEIHASGKKAPVEILKRNYPVELQEQLSKEAATAIGFDFNSGRIDRTTHPFCCGIGPGDCRITTRYNQNFFNESFFGTLHEAGHGIYEQGLSADDFGTPVGSACSLGMHESQSRLWENQVGRSSAFWDFFFPKAKAMFPDALKDVSPNDFVFAINEVNPSFIRVEADETTYNLHIILRFELEQALVSGDLAPADVPGAWNEKHEQLLGLIPPNHALGCLQDIHWSGGGIGYFPTYTLGNLYSAQLMEKARQDLGDLEDQFRRGELAPLKGWLNEKIHQPGHRWPASELCRRVTGESLSVRPLIAYLRQKYAPFYGTTS